MVPELEGSLRLILSLEYLSLQVGEEKSLLYVDWKRQPTREELLRGFTLVVGQLLAYPVKFWLGNFSHIQQIEEEDQHWYAEKIVSDLRFTKVQKVARVVSGNYDAYQTAAHLMSLANQNPLLKSKLEHQVFMSVPSALTWLGITQ